LLKFNNSNKTITLD